MAFTLCYLCLCRILGLLRSSLRTETDKDIEIIVLRHRVRILERQLNARSAHRPADRAILAALSRLLPRCRWRSFLVTPRDAPSLAPRDSERSSLSWWRSMSLIETRHQRSAERIMVAKASFIVAFSLMSLGMILVRRRSSSKLNSARLVVLTLMR